MGIILPSYVGTKPLQRSILNNQHDGKQDGFFVAQMNCAPFFEVLWNQLQRAISFPARAESLALSNYLAWGGHMLYHKSRHNSLVSWLFDVWFESCPRDLCQKHVHVELGFWRILSLNSRCSSLAGNKHPTYFCPSWRDNHLAHRNLVTWRG